MAAVAPDIWLGAAAAVSAVSATGQPGGTEAASKGPAPVPAGRSAVPDRTLRIHPVVSSHRCSECDVKRRAFLGSILWSVVTAVVSVM